MKKTKPGNNLTNDQDIDIDIREVGHVKSIREFIARIIDMPSCISGQMVTFANGSMGMVMGFSENEAQVLVLGSKLEIRAGDEVYSRGEALLLPVGDKFLGRVVNSLCEPIDGLGPIKASDYFPAFKEAPGVMQRVPVEKTLETGTIILDTIIPIAKGQRQLIIGDRLTGKTTIAMDAILNQAGKDVICIYCSIGKPYSSFVRIVDLLKERNTMPYTICVCGVASTSAGEQYLAPYTAAMLGEYFMNNGKDVLVIFDDLTKHAWVYRQISLLLERAPGREAYPGDIFYIHSQLMERAGYLKPELGGGSMTFFPITEVLQGDVTGYISSNLVSMTDGQIYFNTSLFNKGFRPAIDLGLSVSRIGNKAQWPAMKELSKSIRLDYLQYLELLQITQLRTSSLSKEAEARFKRGKAISFLLVQDKNKPVSMEEEILYFYALSKGYLDDLGEERIDKFKKEIFEFIKKNCRDIINNLRKTNKLQDADKSKIDESIVEYLNNIK